MAADPIPEWETLSPEERRALLHNELSALAATTTVPQVNEEAGRRYRVTYWQRSVPRSYRELTWVDYRDKLPEKGRAFLEQWLAASERRPLVLVGDGKSVKKTLVACALGRHLAEHCGIEMQFLSEDEYLDDFAYRPTFSARRGLVLDGVADSRAELGDNAGRRLRRLVRTVAAAGAPLVLTTVREASAQKPALWDYMGNDGLPQMLDAKVLRLG